jgi:hypothetical protein
MNALKLTLIVWTVTVVVAAVALASGCGVNDVRGQNASAVTPLSDRPTGVAAREVVAEAALETAPDTRNDESVDANPELAQREQELARQEAELAAAQERLDERVRTLTAHLDTIEDRERELERRELEPEPPPEPEPPRFVTLTLPASTPLIVELENSVSTETSAPGDPVHARVLDDIVLDGLVAIPAGTLALGTVSDVVTSRKIGGQARLAVQFDTLAFANGERLPMASLLVAEGQPQKKRDAATIGG